MPRREQQDLTKECFDGHAQSKVTLAQFRELICSYCRNPDCVQAKWGQTPFDIRVQTWQERLYGEDRKVSDLSLPAHLMVAKNEFEDISHKVQRLLVSARNNDWEVVPEEESMMISDTSTTKAVDDAVRKLANLKDKKAPELPTPEPVEEDEAEPDLLSEPEPKPVPKPKPRTDGLVNTPIPFGGFNLDGTMAPKVKQGERAIPKQPERDPWAPNEDVVVKPGATVKLGKKPDEE
jgi:hypothetical protein